MELIGEEELMDIGNNCMHCNEDTSSGSGRFVNRVPATLYLFPEYEAEDDEGTVIFPDGEYCDGYTCEECYRGLIRRIVTVAK